MEFGKPTVIVLYYEATPKVMHKWWDGYPDHYEPFKGEVLRWAPMPKPAKL
jgi:hypothetical protein